MMLQMLHQVAIMRQTSDLEARRQQLAHAAKRSKRDHGPTLVADDSDGVAVLSGDGDGASAASDSSASFAARMAQATKDGVALKFHVEDLMCSPHGPLPHNLTYSTMFSGGEVTKGVIESVADALNQTGVSLLFEQLWACEVNKMKQQWIHRAMRSSICLLAHALDLKDGEAKCLTHQKLCRVRRGNGLILGFSCNVSQGRMAQQNKEFLMARVPLADLQTHGDSHLKCLTWRHHSLQWGRCG